MLLKQYVVNTHNEKELEDIEYCGIVMGETYTEITKKLEDYYGKYTDAKITEIDICPLIENEEIISDGLFELDSTTCDSF